MNAETERFRRSLEEGVENEITAHAEELARSIVATVWNAVDDECGSWRRYGEDAGRTRNFYQRSAEHISAKRDLAEAVLNEWENGRLTPDSALRMIRAALAVGDVKTIDQLRAVAS